MARGFVNQQFLQEINKNSLFGQCDPDDLVTADTERREREKIALEERLKRHKEARRSELVQKKQEEEDFLYACQEQRLLNEITFKSLGRGEILNEVLQYQAPSLPRGRGRLTQQERDHPNAMAFFKKEFHLGNQLLKTNGPENYNSNVVQKRVWHGQSTPPLKKLFHSANSSPETFEDAESSSSSSLRSSPDPVVSPSPANVAALPSLGAVRKRGSRLAAKFSYPSTDIDNDETVPTTDNNRQSDVYMSGERSIAPSRFRSDHLPRGFSFNSLDPSQRVLDYDLLQSSDLCNSLNYDKHFPPLM